MSSNDNKSNPKLVLWASVILIAVLITLFVSNYQSSKSSSCDGTILALYRVNEDFVDHMIYMLETGTINEHEVFRVRGPYDPPTQRLPEEHYRDGYSSDEHVGKARYIIDGVNSWGDLQGEWYTAMQFIRNIDKCGNKQLYQEAGLFPQTLPSKELINHNTKSYGIGRTPSLEIVDMMNDYMRQIIYEVDWYRHKYPF